MEESEEPEEENIPVETLEKYVLDELRTSVDLQKRAMITLVFTGEKPGEEVKFLDESRAEKFQEFLEETGLNYRKKESDFHVKYFFTVEEEFLDLLEEEDGRVTVKSSARFRGLPEPVPEKLQRHGRMGLKRKFSQNQEDLMEDVQVEDNEHLFELAGFPPTNWDEVQKAIEIGERREELLRQFDRKNDSKLGSRLLEELKSRS